MTSQKPQKSQTRIVYDIVGITPEEKTAMAAVLSQDSTIAPVKYSLALASFIHKFNSAQKREVVEQDVASLMAKSTADKNGGNGTSEQGTEASASKRL